MTCNYLLLVFVVWYPFYGHFMDTFLKYIWAFQIFIWVLFTCIFFFLGSFLSFTVTPATKRNNELIKFFLKSNIKRLQKKLT